VQKFRLDETVRGGLRARARVLHPALGSLLAGALLTCVAPAFSACSKAESSTAQATGEKSAEKSAALSAEPDPAFLAEVKSKVEAAYKGNDRTPPTDVLPPKKGLNVWIISPGMIGESSSIPVKAAKEAGEAVGWKMTIFDGKLDPSSFSTGIRQAIAAKANGIIIDAIDCAAIKQALQEAKEANVKTVGFFNYDCDDPNLGGGARMFDGMVNFGSQLGDYATLTRNFGAVKADWLIHKTKGKAKLIQFKEDEFLVLKYIREGFEAEFAKCKTCEIVETVDFTLADYGPKLQQKAQAALLKHPEANAVHVPYDTPMHFGVGGALVESGRNDQLEVIAGEGFPSNIQLIHENKGQDAANAFPSEWTGWAAVDALNSVLQGKPPRDGGMGLKLIDREHNLPPSGKGYVPSVDFRALYKKAWGLASK
jgi:ribose transport system substrate-binding protein